MFNLLYSFFADPKDKLLRDSAGNLYGTSTLGLNGDGAGLVFELSPSNGGWILTPLWNFTGSQGGAVPISNLVFRSDGDLYGTTSQGGIGNCGGNACGIVFMLTP